MSVLAQIVHHLVAFLGIIHRYGGIGVAAEALG